MKSDLLFNHLPFLRDYKTQMPICFAFTENPPHPQVLSRGFSVLMMALRSARRPGEGGAGVPTPQLQRPGTPRGEKQPRLSRG